MQNSFRRRPVMDPTDIDLLLALERETFAPERILNLVLAIDRSGSMTISFEGKKTRFDAACASVCELVRMLDKDELRDIVHLSLIVFDDEEEIILDQVPVAEIDVDRLAAKLSTIQPSGATGLGKAVLKAIELANGVKDQMKASGCSYFQPIVAVFSDGMPTRRDSSGHVHFSEASMSQAYNACDKLIGTDKLTVLPFFIGKDSSEGPRILARLCSAQAAKDGLKAPVVTSVQEMRKGFRYLGQTVIRVAEGADISETKRRMVNLLGRDCPVTRHV